MKVLKKVLLVISLIIIAVGICLIIKNGFKYKEGYSKNVLIETAKQYTVYISVATGIIVVYYAIRYSKQGVAKVIATSILGILGASILVGFLISAVPTGGGVISEMLILTLFGFPTSAIGILAIIATIIPLITSFKNCLPV